MYYNALTGEWERIEIPADLPQTSEEIKDLVGIRRNLPTAWEEIAALRASKESPRKAKR